MVAVDHAGEAGSMLIRLSGLWEGVARNGARYLSGSLSESSRLLVFVNGKKEGPHDADWLAFVAPRTPAGGGLIRVARLWSHTSREGHEFLSGPWGSARLLVFRNGFRRKSSEPSHVAYWAPKDPPRQAPAPTQAQEGEVAPASSEQGCPAPG
jgi:hypothetical protein